ncbi:AI-2E family transporter [Oxalobacter sp. OxGP1]|uniref:AI-2E family transporter n=1 Tax=Oxalobacter paeniformigenes TaxID=2946594 RepID=UPI0022B037F8|nr:AI-2E family transporter [Oxalobacter paeniformigenes]MCZ4052880.1 AI-2E family transporter [Oxalobacter paeniformigenes]
MKRSEPYGKVFILFLSAVTIAFFMILLPFYGAVFWGFILAVMFMPLNDYFLSKMPGKRNTASILTICVCLLIVVIPLILVIGALAQESATLYQKIQTQSIGIDETFRMIVSYLPDWIISLLNRSGITTLSEFQQKISSGMLQASQYIAGKLFVIGQNILDFTIGFCIMLYLLFFLLRDGKELAMRIRKIIPLADDHKLLLLGKFTGVIRATVKGNLVVSVVQGALGGLIFWFMGIEAAMLWGATMSVLSLLPSGSGVIWVPVAIYFLATGAILKGILLLVLGVLVIGLADNFLRPLLVGKDTQMPDYLVLISTIGGMALFGLNGFVLGPVIAALFITAWGLYATLSQKSQTDALPPENGNTPDHQA